jgi:hypothetical protein
MQHILGALARVKQSASSAGNFNGIKSHPKAALFRTSDSGVIHFPYD